MKLGFLFGFGLCLGVFGVWVVFAWGLGCVVLLWLLWLCCGCVVVVVVLWLCCGSW